MAFMQYVILIIPSWILCLVILAGTIALSVVSLIVVRRLIPHHKLKQHNDVAGSIFATVGVLYAVLLAFVVVAVWQGFDKSKYNVHQEANYLVDLYRDSESFSPDFKEKVRPLFVSYAKAISREEWALMRTGKMSPDATKMTMKIRSIYAGYIPRNITEEIFFAESVRKLDQMCQLRRLRFIDSREGIHPILWFVLAIGGVVTMTFISFFGAENLKAQVIMASLLAILVGLTLFTILSMDYPFTGGISISNEAFELALSCMQ